jgi:hypothetical protein
MPAEDPPSQEKPSRDHGPPARKPMARSLRTQQRIPTPNPGSESQPMFHPEQPPQYQASPCGPAHRLSYGIAS